MFFTQPAAELRPALPFDLKIKRWAVVERDLETPWFQMTIRGKEGEVDFSRTLLVSDIDKVVRLLDCASFAATVRSIMMVIPPAMNGSEVWSMEQIAAIESARDVLLEQWVYRLATEQGEFEIPCQDSSMRQIYYAEVNRARA